MMVHASATGLPLGEVCPAVTVSIREDWEGKIRIESSFLTPRKAMEYVEYVLTNGLAHRDRVSYRVERVARTQIRRWNGHSL